MRPREGSRRRFDPAGEVHVAQASPFKLFPLKSTARSSKRGRAQRPPPGSPPLPGKILYESRIFFYSYGSLIILFCYPMNYNATADTLRRRIFMSCPEGAGPVPRWGAEQRVHAGVRHRRPPLTGHPRGRRPAPAGQLVESSHCCFPLL